MQLKFFFEKLLSRSVISSILFLGLSKFLDPLFQARRGSKPRLPGLGGPKSG